MFMGHSSNYDHLFNINKEMRDSPADGVMESYRRNIQEYGVCDHSFAQAQLSYFPKI